MYLTRLNLHDIKSEILPDYRGDFQLNGSVVTGPFEHRTSFRLRNMNYIEGYVNRKDIDYDSKDVILTGYV